MVDSCIGLYVNTGYSLHLLKSYFSSNSQVNPLLLEGLLQRSKFCYAKTENKGLKTKNFFLSSCSEFLVYSAEQNRWTGRDSNSRPQLCKSCALPTKLPAHATQTKNYKLRTKNLLSSLFLVHSPRANTSNCRSTKITIKRAQTGEMHYEDKLDRRSVKTITFRSQHKRHFFRL